MRSLATLLAVLAALALCPVRAEARKERYARVVRAEVLVPDLGARWGSPAWAPEPRAPLAG